MFWKKREEKEEVVLWADWQKKAWAGAVAEYTEAQPDGPIIECPNRIKAWYAPWRKIPCKGRLVDTEIVIQCGSERRRITRCKRCKEWFCRLCGLVSEEERKWLLKG